MARSLLLAFLCLCVSLPTLTYTALAASQRVMASGSEALLSGAAGEAPSSSGDTSGKKAAPKEGSGKININTASASELTKLNGIGETTAQRIIEYREANGPFKSVDDLTRVKGIGEKTLAKFRDQITTGDSQEESKPDQSSPKTPEAKNAVDNTSASGKININTASASELTKLNGIGDATAKKIIEYREANGPFKSVDDLTRVKGIGEKTLAKFRDQITVGGDGGSSPKESPQKDPGEQSAPSKSEGSGKININTASASELTKLPGVGETTAQRIIEYREANGPFKSCQELTNVKGIGAKTFEKIEGMCAVK